MTDVSAAEKENMQAEAVKTEDEHELVCNEKLSGTKRPNTDDDADQLQEAKGADGDGDGDGDDANIVRESLVKEDLGKEPEDGTIVADESVTVEIHVQDEEQDDTRANEVPAKDDDALLEDEKAEEAPVISTKIDITKRPVKRARSAYFVFMDDRRAEVQKQHPGEGVAAVARALGQIWSTMTDDEKLPYQQKAAEEREQVAAATEAWKAAGGVVDADAVGGSNGKTEKPDGSTLVFPLGRVRKICRLDPEVRGLSKEALLLVTKAAELATAKLGSECVKTAQIQNRRKLLPDDVAQVCAAREQFLFLREDITDLHRQQQKLAATGNKTATTSNKGKSKDNSEAAKNSKPLTDYFKAA